MRKKKQNWWQRRTSDVTNFFSGFDFDRYVTLGSGVAISVMAAWYSIVGLAAIFPGAALSIMFMGSALEAGKVVAASYLFRNWKKLAWFFRIYLISAVMILMVITSIGIFGYLSKSHIEQNSNIEVAQGRVERINRSITRVQTQIDQKERELEQINAAIESMVAESFASRAVETQARQQPRIDRINTEIDNLESQIETLEEERAPYDTQIRNIETEVGPIRYVAELIYGESNPSLLERAVQYMIIFLVLVFDPLAITLIMLATRHKEDFEVRSNYDDEADQWLGKTKPKRGRKSNAVDLRSGKDLNIEINPLEKLR